jgi:hypothetical protein
MPNTVDQAIAFARAHPTKDVGTISDSWATWCAALVHFAGAFVNSYSTALLAGDATEDAAGVLHTDRTKAPRGAIHYWAGVFIDDVECGHTAIDIGDDNTLLMASSRVSNFGNAIGTIRFADYGLSHYRGWSTNWGAERLSGVGTIERPVKKKEDDMTFRIVDPTDEGDRALYALSDSGHWVKIANPADLLLLQKFRAGDISDINKFQVTTIRRYMQRLSPSAPPFDVQAFAAAVAKKVAGRVMNTADVETSINEAIDEQLPDPSADAVEVDPLQ